MNKFTEQTRIYLRNAGWYPDRNIAIQDYYGILSEYDYPIFPKVEKFLCEYGGLKIDFLLRNKSRSDLNFTLQPTIEEYDSWWIKKNYRERLAKSLCLIGSVYDENLILMMDEEGIVYGGFDDYLCRISDCGAEAIEKICTNNIEVDIL